MTITRACHSVTLCVHYLAYYIKKFL